MFYIQYIRSVLHGHFKRQQEKGRKRGSEIVRIFLKVVVGNPADRSKIKILQALFFFLFILGPRLTQLAKYFTLWSDIFGLNGRFRQIRPLPLLRRPSFRATCLTLSPRWPQQLKERVSEARQGGGYFSLCQKSMSPARWLSLRRLTPTVTIGPSAGVNCSTVHWWGSRSSSLLCPWPWPRLCTLASSYRSWAPGAGRRSPEGRGRGKQWVDRLNLSHICFAWQLTTSRVLSEDSGLKPDLMCV